MIRLKIWIARASVVALAPAVEYGSRFFRTALLSRLLSPTEFGTSVALSTMVAIAALVTDLSLDKFVIVNNSPNSSSLAAAHLLSILRGALVSAALIAAAPATARLFGVSHYSNSFSLVGLYPLLSSFQNLSIKQIQQNFQYTREIIAQAITHISALAAAIVAAYYLHDHRAIVASLFTEAAVYTLASHLMAQAKYRILPDKDAFIKACRFGFPLLANGVGLAAMAQLDRILVGSWLGIEALGNYTVILSLATVPMALLFRVFAALAAPILLRDKDTPQYGSRYAMLMLIGEVASALYALTLAITLDWLTPLIYGHNYQVTKFVHLLLVIIVFFRSVRSSAPTVFLLVAGRTVELAILNLTAGIGVITAFLLLHYHLSLASVLLGLAAGEIIANGFLLGSSSTTRLKSKTLIYTDFGFSCIALTAIMGLLVWVPEPTWGSRLLILVAGLVIISLQSSIGLYNHRYIRIT